MFDVVVQFIESGKLLNMIGRGPNSDAPRSDQVEGVHTSQNITFKIMLKFVQLILAAKKVREPL